jgi:hypothetical protein
MSLEGFEYSFTPDGSIPELAQEPEEKENVEPLEKVRRDILDVKAEIAQMKEAAANGPIGKTRELVPLYEKLNDLRRQELFLQKKAIADTKKRVV